MLFASLNFLLFIPSSKLTVHKTCEMKLQNHRSAHGVLRYLFRGVKDLHFCYILFVYNCHVVKTVSDEELCSVELVG